MTNSQDWKLALKGIERQLSLAEFRVESLKKIIEKWKAQRDAGEPCNIREAAREAAK